MGVRLAAFNLKQIANLTCTDELDLYSIGEKKVALFCCIPDADTSLNYLVGMIYSNLFQTLYYVADRKYHGKLPIPVHCIMDEWPNVALPMTSISCWQPCDRAQFPQYHHSEHRPDESLV